MCTQPNKNILISVNTDVHGALFIELIPTSQQLGIINNRRAAYTSKISSVKILKNVIFISQIVRCNVSVQVSLLFMFYLLRFSISFGYFIQSFLQCNSKRSNLFHHSWSIWKSIVCKWVYISIVFLFFTFRLNYVYSD